MYRFTVTAAFVIAVMSIGWGGYARAADMAAKTPPTPVPYSGSWYGYGGTSIPITDEPNKLTDSGCVYITACSTTMHADSAWGAIGGIGYRFSPYWRVDLRGGYGEAEVSAKNVAGHALGVAATGNLSGDVSGGAVAVTGYLDFKPFFAPGTLGNFEPYVGVGVGVARASFTNYTFASTGGVGVTLVWPNVNATALGWVTTVGTGYRFARDWLIDVGYIYRDYGRFKSGQIVPGGIVGLPASSFSANLSGSAIDLGVRYEF